MSELTETEQNKIIQLCKEGELTQEEIAEKFDTSQSAVSRIKRSYERGKEDTEFEAAKEATKERLSFDQEDDTEYDENDDYFCYYCKQEYGEKVKIEYMADECPNGHDLTGDW